MISQRAQKLAMAKAALGKSQEQVQGMFTSLVDQYEQVINGKQHELEIAKSHTPGFLGRLGASSIQSNIDAYNKTRAEKLGGFNYQFAPLAPDISHVQALVEAGDLPGFEYLQVDPSSWGRLTGALDFTELSSAKMVSGAVDANTITEGEKRKLSSALVDQFRGMKLPNFNEDAARRAVESALGDGDKTQLAQFAQQAGIPLSTMYHFLNEAAMGSEENTANPEWMKIMQLQARYRQQYGGQESLENMALEQAKNALKTRSSLARKAALKIDGSHTTLEDMRSAIEVIASMRRKGTLDSAGEALLGRFDAARLGELKKAQAAVPQAQTDAETAARELGDLAEMQSDDDVLAQIKAMYPQQAGIGANRAGIAALLGRMGPRP
jgi:predicted transcriptional regulator